MSTDVTDSTSRRLSPKFLPQGGLFVVAEALHDRYGDRITCPECRESKPPPFKAYHRNEGGNSAALLKRRQYRCRNVGKRSSTTEYPCPLKSCRSYIVRAQETVGTEIVENIRSYAYRNLKEQGEPCENISKPFSFGSTADASPTPKEDGRGASGSSRLGTASTSEADRPKASLAVSALKRRERALSTTEPAPAPKRRASEDIEDSSLNLCSHADDLDRLHQLLTQAGEILLPHLSNSDLTLPTRHPKASPKQLVDFAKLDSPPLKESSSNIVVAARRPPVKRRLFADHPAPTVIDDSE